MLLIIYVVSVALHLLVEFIPEAALNDILNFPVLSQLAAALLENGKYAECNAHFFVCQKANGTFALRTSYQRRCRSSCALQS